MAHFAQLDDQNIVQRVIAIHNDDCLVNGVESEEAGIAVCKSLVGVDTRWVQTSYNGNFRKRYAGVGYTYDESLDAFIPPSPYPSWTLDAETALYKAPIECPSYGVYAWDEDNMQWKLLDMNIL